VQTIEEMLESCTILNNNAKLETVQVYLRGHINNYPNNLSITGERKQIFKELNRFTTKEIQEFLETAKLLEL